MLERRRLAAACGVIVLLMLAFARNAQAVVVVDFASYAGHDYYLLSPASWLDAEAAAIGLGGHLATIDDGAENSFVANRFGVFTDARNLWIGLSDQAIEGTFVWASGAPLSYTNFPPGEPNDCHVVSGVCTSEDFVHIMAFGGASNGKWNDLPNDLAQWYGVAEVAPVPEPSSLLLFGLGAAAVGRVRRRRLGRTRQVC